MQTAASARSRDDMLRRNALTADFFQREAARLALICHQMSERFLAGGRLLSLGRGAAATDAQHVTVEFVHPVIVGKRALPAIDLANEFSTRLPVLARPVDMVMGFAFPTPDPAVDESLHRVRQMGALTLALTGTTAEHRFDLPVDDPFIAQEIAEILYHVLWETVHVYFEHREQGHDVGASSFLYPFLGVEKQKVEAVVAQVQESMLQKMEEVNDLRARVAESEMLAVADIALAIAKRLEKGGTVITLGNGGSATDANDLALDCAVPPSDLTPIPALSLAAEPATITAIGNDIGTDAVFVRQLIGQARPADVAIGFSTSGSSPNILAALIEARKRGLLTVAIVGYGGGRVVSEGLADHALVVPSDYIPRIQEVQASLYHTLRRRLDEQVK